MSFFSLLQLWVYVEDYLNYYWHPFIPIPPKGPWPTNLQYPLNVHIRFWDFFKTEEGMGADYL